MPRLKFRKKLDPRQRRHKRVRAKVVGTPQRPRLNVFRSSAHIYVQLIDDEAGHMGSDPEREIAENVLWLREGIPPAGSR